MKQTKKLTRGQREYLEKHYKIDTHGFRLVEDTNKYIKVQNEKGEVITYDKH